MLTVLVVLGALVASVVGGWWFVAGVLRLASRPGADPGTARGPLPGDPGPVPPPPAPVSPATDPAGPDGPAARAALRGGTWIGLLERLAVTACVLLGQPSGVAIVVAVKGLGRYPELRENPGASERFVIGTLASLVWAAGWGLLAARVL